MYAIRSYYVIVVILPYRKPWLDKWLRIPHMTVEEAIRIRDNVGGSVTVITVGDDDVITSYSIHYTKLYEIEIL